MEKAVVVMGDGGEEEEMVMVQEEGERFPPTKLEEKSGTH